MSSDRLDETWAAPTKENSAEAWRGIHKLQEEMGELQQVLAKMCACGGVSHWEGELRSKLWDEYADVVAAMHYFRANNAEKDDLANIARRAIHKIALFKMWILTGIKRND